MKKKSQMWISSRKICLVYDSLIEGKDYIQQVYVRYILSLDVLCSFT